MLAAAAAVTVVALGAGTVYAVSRDNDGGGISAGPSDTTVVTDPPGTTSSAPSSTTPPSTVPPTKAPSPPTPAPTTVPVEPVTGTLPPPADVAGVTEYATVGLDALPPALLAEAASPQQKVDALVAFLENEPIEGRRGAQGVVNSVQGNRARVEVRVLGVADDAHDGYDYRLYLLQERPGGPWKVVAAESRGLCSRAFDGTFCV
jgi:hypothetical protein